MSVMDGNVVKLDSIRTAHGERQTIGRLSGVHTPLQRNPVTLQYNSSGIWVNQSISSIAEQRLENAVDDAANSVESSVRETNQNLELNNRTMRFRINRDDNEIQVQIVDSSNGKVIRSIPSDEMMRLASRMRELSGVGAMIDQSR